VVQSHRDRVQTSLLVLDACTDPTTGAVAAAPTTSLPEVVGADRQFDYRYAWLRDASLAAGVAAAVGRSDITQHHIRWLTERCLACEGIPVPIVRTSGEPCPDEVEVLGVAGWAGSQPVRTGNAARDQVQIDGAGLAAEAVWALVRAGAGFGHRAYRGIAGLADHVAAEPRRPSGGIWELREPIEGTSADIGRWLLFDRARRLSLLHEPWARRRRAHWRAHEVEARRRVLGSGLPSGALPLVPGRPAADAAGLLVVVLGLVDRRSPEATRIVDGTIAELGIGHPLRALARYPADVDDGFHGSVGAFVPVSWLAVSALAQIGRVDEAEDLADRLCRSLPGLQPEVLEGDEPLGNVPLVWSHAEAARALFLIRVARLRSRVGRPGVAVWEVGRALRAHRRRSALTRSS
jgi:GH15 family glucan-1,4-alpha-glucosidase